MEFWVVVAAAGAAYVARHMHSSSGNKDNLLEQKQFSKISAHEESADKSWLQQVREKVCPFHRLARKRGQKDVSDEGLIGHRHLNLDSTGEIPFTDLTDGEKDLIRAGLPNGMALLFMGITTGMVSATIANKREIEKLNEQLKWTKDLVQDLQEDIEMNEKFTVKDLDNDGYENPDFCSPSVSVAASSSSSSEIQGNEPTIQTSENKNQYAAENHELMMSKIEAELEAELERLEMSMKVSTLERISDFVELDPEDELDVAQGDLKLDCLNVECPDSTESDRDTSEGTRSEHYNQANYPVSPRELSLRLHEVVESRLKAQIKELEAALHNSQNRACSLEALHILSKKDYTSSESESPANLQSPYCYHEADEIALDIDKNFSFRWNH